MNAIDAAKQAGIDLTLIEESLRLTPEQRAIAHQRALEMALQMEAAFQRRIAMDGHDRTESTAADAVRR
jgi:hypothetical protein